MRTEPKTRSLSAALFTGLLFFLVAPHAGAITFVPRVGHTVSLLPTGDVLIAGGSNYLTIGGALNTAELFLAASGSNYTDTGAMTVARTSHTATVMGNGKVLLVGGRNAVGGVNASGEIYDPGTNAFTAATAGLAARYNHTATLLNNGTVLVCGGQNAAGAALKTCDYYSPNGVTPPGGPLCAIPAGCVNAAPSMTVERALHTATLLKDGKVWFAGGWDGVSTTNGWLTTTEKFNPVTQTFGSAHNLSEARGYHTSVMMGDGKVLVSGGQNAKNIIANVGVLDTQDIYDPVTDSMSPAAALKTRREMHTAVLDPDGSVAFFGGLGNITTSYGTPTIVASRANGSPVYLTDTYSGQLSTGISTTPDDAVVIGPGGYFLSQPVVGTIVEGDIVYSSPSIKFNSGIAYFPPGDMYDKSVGLHSDLAGASVGCKEPGKPLDANCGYLKTTIPFQNLNKGKLYFDPRLNVTLGPAIVTGSMNLPALTQAIGSAPLAAGSSITIDVQFALPAELIGSTITAGTIEVKTLSYIVPSSYTVTVTSAAWITLPPNTLQVVSDGSGGARVTIKAMRVESLVGTVAWNGMDPSYTVTPGAHPVPEVNTTPSIATFANINYVPSRVDITGLTFNISGATIIIRNMLFGSPEYYNPAANLTSLSRLDGSANVVSPTFARAGHTSTLLLSNDTLLTGGYACQNAGVGTCGALIAQSNMGPDIRYDLNYLVRNNNSVDGGTILTPRALHTSTLLPDGTILVVGGSNGPNVLQAAELFDPTTSASIATNGMMKEVRDLHTATLMPNGRVLLAGGFTTNAASSDSTKGVEIYYPDTKLFLPTTSMANERRGHTATAMPDGNVIVTGGLGLEGTLTPTVEIYYSTAAVWRTLTPMVSARNQHTATLLKDGRLLIVGGTNAGGPMTSVVAYNFSSNSWAALSALPVPLYKHTATLLFDGRVLVAGGDDGFGESNSSYLYDPNNDGAGWILTDTFELPLLQPRFGHTATLLPNDTVMMSGGSRRSGIVPNEIESFHINASSWTAGGTTFANGPRAFHTMTLAADGSVYAIGGSDGVIGGVGTALMTSVNKSYFTTAEDRYTRNSPPSMRKSTMTTIFPLAGAPARPYAAGEIITVTGQQFRGGTEASGGGAASANSSFSFPHLVLNQLDTSQTNSGFAVDLTTEIYTHVPANTNVDQSLTVTLPASYNKMPVGWYSARVGSNGVYSKALFLQAGPNKPTLPPGIASGTAVGISSMLWTWSNIAGLPVDGGYNVYQATSGIFLGTAPATVPPATAFFYQTNLPPNTTCSIIVAGFTITGDGPLQPSSTYYTASTSPINVSIASVTFTDLLLQWDTNGNGPGTIYEVSQSTVWPNSGDPFLDSPPSISTPIPTAVGLTKNYVTITQLAENTTYTFRVRAFNGNNLPSTFGVYASTLTRISVAGVSGTAASSTAIDWSWRASPGAINYRVFNATTGLQIGAPVAGLLFSDVGLATNTVRSIQVAAYTAAGLGPLSASATVYTGTAVPLPQTPPVTGLSTGSFSVNWRADDGNPGGTPYKTNIYTVNVGTTVSISTFMTVGFPYTLGVPDLNPSQSYTINMYAINGDGLASPALVIGSTYTLPRNPIDPAFVSATPTSISISWGKNLNPSTVIYQITYSSDGFVSISTAVPFSDAHVTSSATIPGLITSTTYQFEILARNPFGQVSAPVRSAAMNTPNGGAALGDLGGTLSALANSQITGNIVAGPPNPDGMRGVTLFAPSGTFPSDVHVDISSHNAAPALCADGVNVALSLEVSPLFQPLKPVHLTVTYNPLELGGVAPERLAFMRYDPVSNTCVPLKTIFDTKSVPPLFTVALNHFSLYQLAQVPLATSADTARIFPNPYRAASDSYLTIDKIPPLARVRVTTLLGETVFDQHADALGMITWTPSNGVGRSLASGLYLVVVESGGSKKILKLAVVR